MTQNQRMMLLIAGIILTVLIIVSTIFLFSRGAQRTGPGMMALGMMRSRSVSPNSEYDFFVHMIPHHKEAVESLARSIRNTQRNETRMMRAWLAQWTGNDQVIGKSNGIILWIGIIAVVIVVIVLIVNSSKRNQSPSAKSSTHDKAVNKLKERYAEGEISREDYKQMMEDLKE